MARNSKQNQTPVGFVYNAEVEGLIDNIFDAARKSDRKSLHFPTPLERIPVEMIQYLPAASLT